MVINGAPGSPTLGATIPVPGETQGDAVDSATHTLYVIDADSLTSRSLTPAVDSCLTVTTLPAVGTPNDGAHNPARSPIGYRPLTFEQARNSSLVEVLNAQDGLGSQVWARLCRMRIGLSTRPGAIPGTRADGSWLGVAELLLVDFDFSAYDHGEVQGEGPYAYGGPGVGAHVLDWTTPAFGRASLRLLLSFSVESCRQIRQPGPVDSPRS